jgi:predicted Zn-dependent protease
MTTSNYSPPTERPVNRELFLDLVNTALFMDQVRFARQAAVSWLAAFPGDLPVDLIHTQLLLKAGQTNQALAILDRLCQRDPEFLDAASARLRRG